MSAGAEFVGGPADGRREAFPGAEPPARVEVKVLSPDPSRSVQYRVAVYLRRVNMDPSGERWLLDFAGFREYPEVVDR